MSVGSSMGHLQPSFNAARRREDLELRFEKLRSEGSYVGTLERGKTRSVADATVRRKGQKAQSMIDETVS